MSEDTRMINDFEMRGNEILHYFGNGGEVIVPDGVEELEEFHFLLYSKERNAYSFDTKSKITSVFIPNTVKSIDIETFSGMVNLKEVIFEEGSRISVIPRHTFFECKSLRSITLPKSVTKIDYCAFADCTTINVILTSYPKIDEKIFDRTPNGKIIYQIESDEEGAIGSQSTYNHKTKHTEERHLGVFKTSANEALDRKIKIRKIIGFIILILYIGTLALSSVYAWGILISIIVVILGIINIALIISDKGKYYR